MLLNSPEVASGWEQLFTAIRQKTSVPPALRELVILRIAVLNGADYLARLNSPTPWTRRATAAFTDTSRSLCRVALSLGPGEGGLIMTWRFDFAPHDKLQEALRELVGRPGICGVHLCIADRAGSGIVTEEKKGRPAVGVPGFVVLVEGGAERAALEAACRELVFDAPAERGLYQLQYSTR